MSKKFAQMTELEEINKPTPVFTDRFYVIQKQDNLKLVFCDDVPELETSIARVAVSMTISGFFNYVKLLSDHATKLQNDLQNMGQIQPYQPDMQPVEARMMAQEISPEELAEMQKPKIDENGRMRY